MSIVSYAQNFEDVMLWRALQHIKHGNYIDIGAQEPVIDSVSKVFFDAGWRGVHVEPLQIYADKLRAERPGDTILQVAVSDEKGPISFFEIRETGLSTANAEVARTHSEQGFAVEEITVATQSLSDIFSLYDGRDIHWLKIDVEGHELQVLRSWQNHPARPWIVIIESTYPNTQIETQEEWESLVLEKHYRLAYRDGLNRYYIAESHLELEASFTYPPNVFDAFALAPTSWAAAHLSRANQAAAAAAESRYQDERSKLETLVEALKYDLKALERPGRHVLEDVLAQAIAERSALEVELVALKAEIESGVAAQAERDGEESARLEKQVQAAESREEAWRSELAEVAAAATEQRLEYERRLETSQLEIAERTNALKKMEQDWITQRDAMVQEAITRAERASQETAEAVAAREEARRDYEARLEGGRIELAAHTATLARREQEWAAQASTMLQAARQREDDIRAAAAAEQSAAQLRAEERIEAALAQTQAHLRALNLREQAFTERLSLIQSEFSALLRAQSERADARERDMFSELTVLRDALIAARQTAAEQALRYEEQISALHRAQFDQQADISN